MQAASKNCSLQQLTWKKKQTNPTKLEYIAEAYSIVRLSGTGHRLKMVITNRTWILYNKIRQIWWGWRGGPGSCERVHRHMFLADAWNWMLSPAAVVGVTSRTVGINGWKGCQEKCLVYQTIA